MSRTARFLRPLLLIVLGMLATGIVGIGYAFRPAVLESFQHRLDDLLLSSVATGLRSDRIAIVDIDDRSLKELGQWPWPRTTIATLVDAVAAQNPLCVVLDVLFTEPDRTNASNDAVLAKSLAAAPVLLGYQFHAEPAAADSPDCLLLPLKITLVAPPGESEITLDLLTARSITCVLPELAAASASEGFLNVFPDDDGVIRKVPLLMGWQGKLYPSLALAAALFVMQDPTLNLHVSPGGVEQLELEKQSNLPDIKIPLDPYGQLTVNYRGKAKTFPYVSALDLINHNRKGDFFNKKIVFVGTSAAGLADLRTTPLGTNIPGVEIQATAADNILQGDYLRRSAHALGLEFAVLIVTGLLTALSFVFCNAWWRLLYVLLYGAGIWFGAKYLICAHHLFLSPFYPYLCLLGVFLVVSLFWDKKFAGS